MNISVSRNIKGWRRYNNFTSSSDYFCSLHGFNTLSLFREYKPASNLDKITAGWLVADKVTFSKHLCTLCGREESKTFVKSHSQLPTNDEVLREKLLEIERRMV